MYVVLCFLLHLLITRNALPCPFWPLLPFCLLLLFRVSGILWVIFPLARGRGHGHLTAQGNMCSIPQLPHFTLAEKSALQFASLFLYMEQ